MAKIPENYVDLLDRPILFMLATVQPDGQPQVTPVWGDFIDGKLRINTAQGRQKWKNLTERPQATVLIIDPDNGMRYMEIRGKVVDETTEGADGVIDKLAQDYLGVDVYPFHKADETRVTFLIEPVKVMAAG